jgi:ATP-dependent exoDNAse (exonuclease V) alpha subunit
MNQATALKILQSGKNVFLTGSAGTGKTYVLNLYTKSLKQRGVSVAITASTGIAATHIGGQTIHSWSGLGIKDTLTEADLEKIARKKPVRQKIEATKVLVIDEISMLSGQILTNIDKILRYIKISFEPFGGIQVIFSGDFFQLPPVTRVPTSNAEKFAFMAPIWRELKLHTCYLTDQYRQNDDSLSNFLNEMRTGEISDSGFDALRESMENAEHQDDFSVKLYTHNADVDRINAAEIKKLTTTSKHHHASGSGNSNLLKALQKSVLTDPILELKEGAQVMFIKNNHEKGFMNGTMGTVTGFTLDDHPIVMTHDNREIHAKPEDWTIHDETGKPAATYTQVPLRHAWAITIHKSQGMTLDSAEIDLSKTFERGQGYVALSRVKSWDGVKLLGCNQRALELCPLALAADKRFQQLSGESDAAYTQKTEQDTETDFETFIKKSGGTNDPETIAINQLQMTKKHIEIKKEKTHIITKSLLEEGRTIDEIIEVRNLKEDTIFGHIKKVKEEFPLFDLSIIRPEDAIFEEIMAAYIMLESQKNPESKNQYGNLKLKPLHEHLDEKYSYQAIKKVLIFAEKKEETKEDII